jgi:putative ABC transport system permease protein
VRVKNAPFRIVGALVPKGINMFGGDQDDVLLVPYTSAMKRLSGDLTFRSMMVGAESSRLMASLTNQITELLNQRHKIGPAKEADFMVRTQQDMAEFADAQAKIMRQFLTAVAGISLLVGGIGVMNIMLVSVTERTREIGVRMAVGARSRDILLQFLTEAVTLSVVGGGLGILLGMFLPDLRNAMVDGDPWATQTSGTWIAIAFCVSAGIGIIFGFYPAWKAAQLDPIDALRYE